MDLPVAAYGPGRRRGVLTRALAGALTVCAAVALGASVGALTVSDDIVALAIAGLVAAAGLAAVDPVLVAVAAFPSTLILQRTGGGSVGSSLSVADLMIVLGVVVVLPQVRWERTATLRRVLLPALAYEAIILPTVLAHPNAHDSLEWLHRLEMVVGALVLGWAVGASGRAKQAVTAFLIGCIVLAALTVEHAFALHFEPGQWGLYQKNYLGSVLWMGAAAAHINPPWLGVPRRFARVAKYVCAVGILAAQAKQDIIALALVVLLAAFLDPRVRRRSRMLVAATLALLIAGYFMLAAELSGPGKLNTVTERTGALSSDFHIWLQSPIFGEGMRWFYLPQFASYGQPPNILLETLTDTGLVGLLAILVLLVGSARIYLSLPRAVSTLALVLLAGRVVEAIFDVYWVSPQTTLPWMIAGLALGAWDAGLVGVFSHEPSGRALQEAT